MSIHDDAVTLAVTADGTMMSFTGCVQVPIRIKGETIETRLLISSDISYPVMLGFDFFEENNVILNYDDKNGDHTTDRDHATWKWSSPL